VLRFDTQEHLREWSESDTRAGFIERVKPLLVDDEKLEIKTGLEYWFTPPSGPPQKKAKPFKQFLVTLSAIFPLTVVVPLLLAPVFRLIPTLGLPIVSNFVVAVIIVFLMIYVIMPRYTKLIARWLFS
jgi:antibiotic biosynthesis monooxygenase (ABM) superfamily enzyme